MDLRAAAGTALLIDAAGTLLSPTSSIVETYARFARSFGGTRTPEEIAAFTEAPLGPTSEGDSSVEPI